MNNVLEKICKFGVVPVVVLENVEDAEPLAKALCEGGLPCAEITFRTKAAEESIRIMSEMFPHMLIGAGSVITTEQVDKAMGAGAKFIVSPGINTKIVKQCQEKRILITPGCMTPSEIEQAIECGLSVVKFFPAEILGGVEMVKAIAAPYGKMKFIPTGGVNATNVKDYLSFNKVIACGGSWMVKSNLIKEKKFDKIVELTKEAVEIVRESRGE